MITEEIQMNVEQQNQLSEEILLLESKINSLQSHLNNLKTLPQTVDINAECLTTSEIIQQAQEAVRRQQEALARQTEAEAIGRSLNIFRAQLAEKRDVLQIAKRSSEFERMQALAHEFNDYIDKAFSTLDKMRKIHEEIRTQGYSPLTITADLNEVAYCSIYDTIIRVRRRLDAKRVS